MSKLAAREVQANGMGRRIVEVREGRIIGQEVTDHRVVVIAELVKQLGVSKQVVVQPSGSFFFFVWRLIAAIKGIEGRRERNRRQKMLQYALACDKEEQLLRHDRSTEGPTYVIALIGVVQPTGKIGAARAFISEQVKSVPMVVLAPSLGCDVDRS